MAINRGKTSSATLLGSRGVKPAPSPCFCKLIPLSLKDIMTAKQPVGNQHRWSICLLAFHSFSLRINHSSIQVTFTEYFTVINRTFATTAFTIFFAAEMSQDGTMQCHVEVCVPALYKLVQSGTVQPH